MRVLADQPLTPSRLRIAPARAWRPTLMFWLFPLLYALAAWFLFSGLGLFDSTRIPGCACEDPVNEVWFLAFTRESLASGHLPFWTNLMGYPRGFNAADNASFPLLGTLAWPLIGVFGPLGTYNFLLRLGLFVSALSCFLVLRWVCTSVVAAGVGGLVYGFSPYMVHVVQLHVFLAWVPLPPVILSLVYRQLTVRTANPWVVGVVLGLLVSAQYLFDAEIAASCVIVGALTGLMMLVGRALRGSPVAGGLRAIGIPMLVGGVVCAVMLAYPVWQFLDGRAHVGATQPSIDTGFPFMTTVLAPSAAAFPGNLAGNINNLAGRIGPLSVHYAGLFGGAGYVGPVLIVALIWIVIRYRGLLLVRAVATLLVLAWVLALGPDLVRTTGSTHFRLPMWLVMHLPTLRDLVAGRFVLYVWLAVAVLVAVAVDRCAAWRRDGAWVGASPVAGAAGRRAMMVSGAVVALAGVGLLLVAPSGRIVPVSVGVTKPFLSRRIQSRIPTGGAVFVYPYPTFPYDIGMLWQAEAGLRFKLVGGAAKFPSPQTAVLLPPLLKPRVVECFLGQAQWPRVYWDSTIPGGCPLVPIHLTPGVLRTYVHRNRIAAIVVKVTGNDPVAVVRVVTAAYGKPAVSGPFLAWRTV